MVGSAGVGVKVFGIDNHVIVWLLMLLRMVIEFGMENKTESSGKGSKKRVQSLFLILDFLVMLEVKMRSLRSEDFKQHGVHVLELGARASW